MSMQARGSLSLATRGIMQLIADSTTFRASVQAADADAALRHIQLLELEALDEAIMMRDLRPLAIVMIEDHRLQQVGVSAGNDMAASGSVTVVFTRNALPQRDANEVTLDFQNWLGCILDEIAELTGRDNYFPVREIAIVQGPNRAFREERATDDYFVAGVTFTHSIDP